jgi:glucose-1-phosphate thymidylyltransferase
MKGVILHGGHGTRLRPLTHTGPKQLLPIANKPMSEYCLESLKSAGVSEIAIIVGGTAYHKVQEHYGDGTKFGVRITYVHQDAPKGISHAIKLCQDFIKNEKFIVFLGDNILRKKITDFAQEFEKSDSDATVLLCEVDNPTQFGIADINSDGSIKKIMEKPKNPPTNLAVTGIYFLTPKIFEIIDRLKPSWRGELEITDALQMLLEEGNKITYHKVTDYWKDTGTPNDIIHANKVILDNMEPYFYGKKEEGCLVEGKVMIGKNSLIKSGATVRGPVIIGDDCIINSNTIIGPNTSIGNNTVLSGCSIENSIVMAGCKIDSKTRIKDSIIAYNSEIVSNNSEEGKVFLLGEGTRIFL